MFFKASGKVHDRINTTDFRPVCVSPHTSFSQYSTALLASQSSSFDFAQQCC